MIRLWKGVDSHMSRIVVKVGTSTLAHKGGRMNIRHIENLVKVLSDLKNAGHEIILVSSGAIGMGAGKLGLSTRLEDRPGNQAAAAVGQCELMYTYDRLFSEYNHTVAQILLTGDDLEQPERRSNFENTLFRLLEYNAIPILNENDTMATAEISVGDNDTLGALVAVYANADLLIVAGTSLTVYPAAGLINYYRGSRLVLINRDVTPYDSQADLLIQASFKEVFPKLHV